MVNRKACQNPKHVGHEVDVLQQHKTTSGSTVKPNQDSEATVGYETGQHKNVSTWIVKKQVFLI